MNSNTTRNVGKDKPLASICSYYSNMNLTSRKNNKTICNTKTSNNNNRTDSSMRWTKHAHSKSVSCFTSNSKHNYIATSTE